MLQLTALLEYLNLVQGINGELRNTIQNYGIKDLCNPRDLKDFIQDVRI